jgi:hypothetical protein
MRQKGFQSVSSQNWHDIVDLNFDRKLDTITAGARPFVKEHLLTRITPENCVTIVDYILAMQTEVSPAQTYQIDTIDKLKYFGVPQPQALQRRDEAGRYRFLGQIQET